MREPKTMSASPRSSGSSSCGRASGAYWPSACSMTTRAEPRSGADSEAPLLLAPDPQVFFVAVDGQLVPAFGLLVAEGGVVGVVARAVVEDENFLGLRHHLRRDTF